MSKIALTGNASGTGVFTIASPNSNTDRTLTLPDEAGTVDTLQRAGNVLQVVYGTTSTIVQSSTSTYIDTGLSASITPSSTSSKILVIVDQNGCGKSGDTFLQALLVRNTTNLIQFGYPAGFDNTTGYNVIGSMSCTYLDSPATTSSVTYKTTFSSSNNISFVQLQWNSLVASTITLLEIAA